MHVLQHSVPQTLQQATTDPCLLWRYRSAVVYYRDGGSGCGYGISPLGGGHQKPHYRVTRTYIGLDSWRAQQNLVHQDPGERNSASTGDLPVGVWESPAKVWVMVACCRVGGTDCSNTCLDSFEGCYH